MNAKIKIQGTGHVINPDDPRHPANQAAAKVEAAEDEPKEPDPQQERNDHGA